MPKVVLTNAEFMADEKVYFVDLEFMADEKVYVCLLYTTDAADERTSGDFGGRPFI